MIRTLATAAFVLFAGAAVPPVFAETGAAPQPPAAGPRSDLSPTDETELAPRTPPVNTPKPMARTRMGEPADLAPAHGTAPAERAAPPENGLAQPRRAAPARQAVRRHAATMPRRTLPARQRTDTSLSAIFARPRFDADAPLRGPAPQSGRRPAAHHYAAVPRPQPERDEAPCPTRARDSLAALFACAR
jgi:hypothetical protein